MSFSGLLFHVYILCVAILEGLSQLIGLHSLVLFLHQSLKQEYYYIRYRLSYEQEDESLAPVVLTRQPQRC